jgi:hypothetical protein
LNPLSPNVEHEETIVKTSHLTAVLLAALTFTSAGCGPGSLEGSVAEVMQELVEDFVNGGRKYEGKEVTITGICRNSGKDKIYVMDPEVRRIEFGCYLFGSDQKLISDGYGGVGLARYPEMVTVRGRVVFRGTKNPRLINCTLLSPKR